MDMRVTKSDLCTLSIVALTFVTVVGLLYTAGWAIQSSLSRPHPIHGPLKGWDFTVMGMDGNQPTELLHEWSCGLIKTSSPSSQDVAAAPPTAQLPAGSESDFRQRIVWANTGRANGPFSYYLTDADLEQVNTQLDSGPDEYPHSVRAKLLEDDPTNRRQIVQLTVSGEDEDFISVYQVQDERVQPLEFGRFRGREVAFYLVPLLPIFLGLSTLFWRWLLRKWFFASNAVP